MVDVDVEMGKGDVDVEMEEVDVDVEIGKDGDKNEEKQRMQDYYGYSNTSGRVFFLKEEDGLIVYGGEGTETDPVVVK